MDFRERLLRNEIRHLRDNVKALSEQMMIIQDFIEREFGSKLKKFVELRGQQNYEADGSENGYLNTFVKMDSARPQAASISSGKRMRGSIAPRVASLSSSRMKKRTFSDQNDDYEDNDDEEEEEEEFQLDPKHEMKPLKPEYLVEVEVGSNDFAEEGSLNFPYFAADGNSESNDSGDSAAENVGSDPEFDLSEYMSTGGSNKKKSKKKSKKVKMEVENDVDENLRSGGYLCGVCDQTIDASEIKNHIEEHTEEESDEKLVCRLCYSTFKSVELFQKHKEKAHGVGIHKQTELTDISCTICGKVCRDRSRRLMHEKTHTISKPFSCGICSASFTRKDSVKRHLKRFHKVSQSDVP